TNRCSASTRQGCCSPDRSQSTRAGADRHGAPSGSANRTRRRTTRPSRRGPRQPGRCRSCLPPAAPACTRSLRPAQRTGLVGLVGSAESSGERTAAFVAVLAVAFFLSAFTCPARLTGLTRPTRTRIPSERRFRRRAYGGVRQQ